MMTRMMVLSLKAWTMLGIAITFYMIGEPIFAVVGNLLNLPFTWEIIVIGLFIGLLPRREATILYAFGLCVSLVEMAVNYPKLKAEVYTMVQGAGLIGPFIPVVDVGVSGFNIPSGLVVILLVAEILVMVKYREKLWPFLKVQLFIYTIMFGSVILPALFTVLTFPHFSPGLSRNEFLPITTDWITSSLIIFSVWLIITGPFLVYLFLRFLGLYKQVPSYITN